MRHEQGMTLIELLTVLAVASIAMSVTAVYSVPWMARQTMHSAVHDVQGLMQIAKMEAVSRNRDCRFVVDTTDGALQVWDTIGTSDRDDDRLMHSRVLSDSVGFARPDVGNPVTLDPISGTASFEAVFTAQGAVDSGTGDVFLRGGDTFAAVAVHGAGGIEISHWSGTSWKDGL